MEKTMMIWLVAVFAVAVVVAAFADWSIFPTPLVLGTAAILIVGGMGALRYADSERAPVDASRQWRGAGVGALCLGGVVALGCILSTTST